MSFDDLLSMIELALNIFAVGAVIWVIFLATLLALKERYVIRISKVVGYCASTILLTVSVIAYIYAFMYQYDLKESKVYDPNLISMMFNLIGSLYFALMSCISICLYKKIDNSYSSRFSTRIWIAFSGYAFILLALADLINKSFLK